MGSASLLQVAAGGLITGAFGPSIVTYFPKVIMGAVLMYLGLTFLVEWTYESRFKLPKIDIVIIWMILGVIAVFGFLQGVALGFIAAVIMFAISCSRTDVVRHEMSGKAYHSQVTRLLEQRQVLDQQGDKLYILQLQGFIFFGTVDRLFNKIKTHLNDRRKLRPQFVVLDFQRVANLDSTGMLSFRKLKDLTTTSRTHIVITAPTRKIKRQLEHGGLPASEGFTHYFPSLDAGLEWCEDRMLESAGLVLDEKPPSLEEQLKAILPASNRLSELFDYLERHEISPGISIIRQGEKPDDLYFIESGRITTQLDQPDGTPTRLETMRNGHTVGEIGFYLGKRGTATVITDEPSVIYRLSATDLKRLERRNPQTANLLHQVVIQLLAERLMHMRRTIDALQK